MLYAQDFAHATPLWSGGYCDMPYAIKLPSGNLFSTLTVSSGSEGAADQHCIGLRSIDNGATWQQRADIDPATMAETSWAMPWYDDATGRLYVVELWNKNNIRSIPFQNVVANWTRVDTIGWPRVKYSTDEGASWTLAGPQGFATYPPTNIDNRNPYTQATSPHKLQWLSGHPKKRNGHVYYGFSKMGRIESPNIFVDTEAFLFKAPLAPTDTQWQVLPTTPVGIKCAIHPTINPTGSAIAEEPSFEFLDDSTIYCVFRTITGYLGEAISTDGGNTFTSGWAQTETGRNVYNPRSKAVVQALSDGRYMLIHCNNAVKNFTERDVLWVRIGNRDGNRVIWGEARAIAYNSDPTRGISYPTALELGDGNVLFTATDKKNARCWTVPLAAI